MVRVWAPLMFMFTVKVKVCGLIQDGVRGRVWRIVPIILSVRV